MTFEQQLLNTWFELEVNDAYGRVRLRVEYRTRGGELRFAGMHYTNVEFLQDNPQNWLWRIEELQQALINLYNQSISG